jgi:hypothetical protein
MQDVMLELPITIRTAKAEEIPHRGDVSELLEKRQTANIVEGYMLKPNRTPQLPFKFYAEININNSRLWDLLVALTAQLPEEVSCSYGLSEEEAVSTVYQDTAAIMQVLSGYKVELTQDCYLEFGMVTNSRERLIEISVAACKYIKFWGVDEVAFKKCMQDFKLREIVRLEFIDEYPKIIKPLTDFIKTARTSAQVIQGLDRAFNIERDGSAF